MSRFLFGFLCLAAVVLAGFADLAVAQRLGLPEGGVRETALRVGDYARSFPVIDENGRSGPIGGAFEEGKAAILFFTAGSGCESCLRRMAELQSVYDEIRRNGAELIVVFRDEPAGPEGITRARQRTGATYPIVLDPEGRGSGEFYSVDGYQTYFIAANGEIVEIMPGRVDDWPAPRNVARYFVEPPRTTRPLPPVQPRPVTGPGISIGVGTVRPAPPPGSVGPPTYFVPGRGHYVGSPHGFGRRDWPGDVDRRGGVRDPRLPGRIDDSPRGGATITIGPGGIDVRGPGIGLPGRPGGGHDDARERAAEALEDRREAIEERREEIRERLEDRRERVEEAREERRERLEEAREDRDDD